MLNVLEKSHKQKAFADKLLRESGLIEFLSKYGEVHIIGSYAYDLMLNADIDIHVINPDLNKEMIQEMFGEMMKNDYFYAYKLADFYDKARRPGVDRGYLLGLRYWSNEVPKWNSRWKFDVWFLEKENSWQKEMQQLVDEKLTEEKKTNIIELKEWRNKFNTSIESYHIYRAVLEHGVKTPEDLVTYWESVEEK